MISLCKSVQNYSVHFAFYFFQKKLCSGIQTSNKLEYYINKIHETFFFVNFFSPALEMFRRFLEVVQKNNCIFLPIIDTFFTLKLTKKTIKATYFDRM